MIPRKVVYQLVVDAWSVDCPEFEQSGDRTLVQNADLVVECLGDYSSLFVV